MYNYATLSWNCLNVATWNLNYAGYWGQRFTWNTYMWLMKAKSGLVQKKKKKIGQWNIALDENKTAVVRICFRTPTFQVKL